MHCKSTGIWGLRAGLQGSQLVDPFIIRSQILADDGDDSVHTQGASGLHFLEVRPVFGTIVESLEHAKVVTREKRDLLPGEDLPTDSRRDLLVIGRCVDEQVDGCLVPSYAHLAVAFEELKVSASDLDACRQRACHLFVFVGIDEDVDVDVDGAPGAGGAPGQCECAAECVRQIRAGQRLVNLDNARRQVKYRDRRQGNSFAWAIWSESDWPVPVRLRVLPLCLCHRPRGCDVPARNLRHSRRHRGCAEKS